MRKANLFGLLGIVGSLSAAVPAYAGVPECNNVRFDDVFASSAKCEVRVNATCTAGCSELGIYKTACATKLVTTCGPQCMLSAMPTCTDGCTVQCKSDCDNGVNVICAHNCFSECTTNRETSCGANADPEQCRATWNANCDKECDSKCVTVDGACYQHCVECCDGSCTADSNMVCQDACVTNQVETCQQEFRANCEASCNAEGALFCDGQFIIAGSQLKPCMEALIAQGFTVKAEANVTIGPDGINGDLSAGFCSYGPDQKGSLVAPFALLAIAAGWFTRRRKQA